MSDPKKKIAEQFFESIPHSKALGMEIVEIGDGAAVIQMPYDARLVGDPSTGVIAGGAVYALMDTCAGAAVRSRSDGTGTTATLDLRIDYMRPATPGAALTARAECYQTTRSVAFVRATADDGERARPVATVTGAFTFEKAK